MQNKVNYLRVVLTPFCNLSCSYCHKEGMVNFTNYNIKSQFVGTLLQCFYEVGIRKFKFMGGEPTLYEELPALLKNLDFMDSDISLISNGIFDKNFIDRCFDNGLQRVNISVHAWSDIESMKLSGMTQEQLSTMKNNLSYLIKLGKLTKINYVYMKRSSHDELLNLIDWVNDNKQVLDILNIISVNNDKLDEEFSTFDEIIDFLQNHYKFRYIQVHKNLYNPDSLRITLDKGACINLKTFPLNRIRPFNSCKSCRFLKKCYEGIRAIRLTYDGYIQPCLLRTDNRFDIRSLENIRHSEITNIVIS